MSDPVPTRQDVVEANILAVETKYGTEAWTQISVACLKDISVSLAMLVDAGASTASDTTT